MFSNLLFSNNSALMHHIHWATDRAVK
jgi:hypothetical protein